MTEIEIIEHIALRAQINWSIIQWWISASFGVMIASFVGSEHLTKWLAALSVSLYTLYSAASLSAIFNHNDYIFGAYRALETLAENSELTPLGIVALENSASPAIPFMPALCLAGFLCTIGFVVYCLVNRPGINE